MVKRPDWDEYFLKQAFLAAERSTCLHHHVGAVIVRDRRVLTTGYNGVAQGETHCSDIGYCQKEKVAEKRGEVAVSGRGIDDCPVIHAEENALLQGARIGVSLFGSTMYVTHQPCFHCSKRMIQAGIVGVNYVIPYSDKRGIELLKRRDIEVMRFEMPRLEIGILK